MSPGQQLPAIAFFIVPLMSGIYCFRMSDNASLMASPGSKTMLVVPQNAATNPTRLLQAASDPIRWAILRELAKSRSRSVLELGKLLKRDPDLISKHLRVLRDADAVTVVAAPDGDRRKQHHAVPETFRRTDDTGQAVLDYGVLVLRFP